jgi:hypothetical protein
MSCCNPVRGGRVGTQSGVLAGVVFGLAVIAFGLLVVLIVWDAEYCVTSCDLGVFVEEGAKSISSGDLDVGVDRFG